MDIIREIHGKLAEEQILFIFRGDITERNSLPLLTLLENEMKDESFGFTGRKRLFMYALESLQNIAKHGERISHELMPLVAYMRVGNGYRILTANLVASVHEPMLREKLQMVNDLDGKEIKELYKRILMNSEFSEKGGAGLGLIEMAVKTGNRLDFDFRPAGKGYSYFILSKTVDSTGMGVHNGSPYIGLNGSPVMELEKLMADNKIYMVWTGHLNSEIGEEMLSIAETRFTDKDIDTVLGRKVFNIMVEMMENVTKYNPGKEPEEKYGMPAVVLRLDKGRFVISTGNLIHNEKVNDLNVKLELINNKDQEELKELFFNSLSGQSIDTDSTGNLGLISMARKSGRRLTYDFQKINEIFSYFNLSVKVGGSTVDQ